MMRPLFSAMRGGLVLAPFLACAGHPEAPTAVDPPALIEPRPTGRTMAESSVLAGDYTLTLSLGTGCAAIPAAERTRTYSAHIAPPAATGDRGSSLVTLGGATFLAGPVCTAGSGRYAGIGCHQFFEAESAERAKFSVNDDGEAHGGHIVEHLPSGSWIEIAGEASGVRNASGMQATGTSQVSYCAAASPNPFPCAQLVGCNADLTLTLVQR
jgi:hypothetical protein